MFVGNFFVFRFFTVATCSIVVHQWTEFIPIDMTATLQIFINGDEIPPQPSPLHAEQTQVSHLFFAWAMLLAPHLLPSARLVLGDSHLEQGSPELDMVLQMWPHWGRVDKKDHAPQTAGHPPFNVTHWPGYRWSSWPQGHTDGWRPTCRPPGRRLQGAAELFSCRSASNLYWCMLLFLPGARLYLCSCWTSSGSLLSNLLDCPCLRKWQHSLLVSQMLSAALYHQQTCWGWILCLHPVNWRSCRAILNQAPGDPSNILKSGLDVTSASFLTAHECITLGPMDLCALILDDGFIPSALFHGNRVVWWSTPPGGILCCPPALLAVQGHRDLAVMCSKGRCVRRERSVGNASQLQLPCRWEPVEVEVRGDALSMGEQKCKQAMLLERCFLQTKLTFWVLSSWIFHFYVYFLFAIFPHYLLQTR